MPRIFSFAYFLLVIPAIAAGTWALVRVRKILQVNYGVEPRKINKVIMYAMIKIIIIIFIILILLPFIGLRIATNHHVKYKNNSMLQYIYSPKEFDIEENAMTLKTEDGYDVWVSEVSVEKPSCVIIYLTGIEQPSVTQFYPHAKLMSEKGYASFLLEVRGHGKSSGNKVCLAYDEVADVKAVMDYIKGNEKYKNVPVVLHGVSMGGSIALNSFGQIEDVDAVIAMSPYSSIEDEVCEVMKHYKVPKPIISFERPLVKKALERSFGKDKVNNMKPIKQIQNANGRKVFLIGSSGDSSVPIGNLHRLQKVCTEAKVWVKDSWEHFIVNGCNFHMVNEDKEYVDKISGFLEEVVQTEKGE